MSEQRKDLFKFSLTQPQVECPITHHFAPGVYNRELFIPAGTCIVGYYHRYATMNIFVKGKMVLAGDDGPITLEAPMTFVSPPGIQKAAIALDDCIFMNVWNIEGSDVDALEDILFVKNAPGFTLPDQSQKLLTHEQDNADFAALGVDEEAEAKTHALIPVAGPSFGSTKYKIARSNIHGKGVIATGHYHPGERIGPLAGDGFQTDLGRYINHSATPNARMCWVDGVLMLEATEHISGYRGGFDGDEITVCYRLCPPELKGVTLCAE